MAKSNNEKQRQKFVERYCIHFNATRAAKEAGYSEKTAYSQGHRLLKNVEIQKAIDKNLNQHAMSAEEVLARIGDNARNLASRYIVIDKSGRPTLDLEQMNKDGVTHVIKGIKYTKSGDPVIELYSSERALETLAKNMGLLKETVELPGLEDAVRPLAEMIEKTYGK